MACRRASQVFEYPVRAKRSGAKCAANESKSAVCRERKRVAETRVRRNQQTQKRNVTPATARCMRGRCGCSEERSANGTAENRQTFSITSAMRNARNAISRCNAYARWWCETQFARMSHRSNANRRGLYEHDICSTGNAGCPREVRKEMYAQQHRRKWWRRKCEKRFERHHSKRRCYATRRKRAKRVVGAFNGNGTEDRVVSIRRNEQMPKFRASNVRKGKSASTGKENKTEERHRRGTPAPGRASCERSAYSARGRTWWRALKREGERAKSLGGARDSMRETPSSARPGARL